MNQALPAYLCPKCGDCIGYVGRFFQKIGVSLHECRQTAQDELVDRLVAQCVRSRQPIRQDVRVTGFRNETWRVTVERADLATVRNEGAQGRGGIVGVPNSPDTL